MAKLLKHLNQGKYMYRKLTYGYVFDSEDSEKVMALEGNEATMLRSIAHVRGCCSTGHRCKKGYACKRKCNACHVESMAIWDGQKAALSRQADAFLNSKDGVPVWVGGRPPVEAKKEPSPGDPDLVSLAVAVALQVIEELKKSGITFQSNEDEA